MIAFVFPGQGSQSLGMGKEILEENPEYRVYLEKAKNAIGVDIEKIIFGEDEQELTLTQNAQAAIVTISYIKYRYAIDKLGMKPDVVSGHSVGEWSALLAADVLPFEEAVRLVYLRGKYMSQACPPGEGTMAAILGLSVDKIEEVLKNFPDVVIANHNTPAQIVISGKTEQVTEAMEKIKEAGAKKVVPLKVSGPFHSHLIAEAQERLAEEVRKIEFNTPSVPVVQNVSARFETDPKIIKENIIKQITSPVRWVESVEEKFKNGVQKFVEVGPGKVLTGLIKNINKEAELANI